jgi:hypothetical protein
MFRLNQGLLYFKERMSQSAENRYFGFASFACVLIDLFFAFGLRLLLVGCRTRQ